MGRQHFSQSAPTLVEIVFFGLPGYYFSDFPPILQASLSYYPLLLLPLPLSLAYLIQSLGFKYHLFDRLKIFTLGFLALDRSRLIFYTSCRKVRISHFSRIPCPFREIVFRNHNLGSGSADCYWVYYWFLFQSVERAKKYNFKKSFHCNITQIQKNA